MPTWESMLRSQLSNKKHRYANAMPSFDNKSRNEPLRPDSVAILDEPESSHYFRQTSENCTPIRSIVKKVEDEVPGRLRRF